MEGLYREMQVRVSRGLHPEPAAPVRTLRDDLVRSLPEVGPYRDGVELLTSFEAWDRMRTDQKLGRDRTRRVVEEAVAALLERSAPAKRRTSR
ncbi:MAG: hypothetical protein P8R42_06330 [Candidatus Binatia bacterium]|nr:hypothetical protein [Candidatus Binatia bacterium]